MVSFLSPHTGCSVSHEHHVCLFDCFVYLHFELHCSRASIYGVANDGCVEVVRYLPLCI